MPSPELPTIEPRSRERLSTLVAKALRTAILSGQLKPGDQLPVESELCSHFGVSRITIREAVQRLRALGLLESVQGRGTFVTDSGPAGPLRELALLAFSETPTISDLFEVRRLLETFAATKAAADADAGKELLAIVDAARDLMRSAKGPEEVRIGLSHLHSRFHGELGRLSGNAVLEQFLGQVIDLVSIVRFRVLGNPSQPHRFWNQHRAIAEAIISGNEALIAERVAEHLDDVQGAIASTPHSG